MDRIRKLNKMSSDIGKLRTWYFVRINTRLDFNSMILCKVGIFRVKKYNKLFNLG